MELIAVDNSMGLDWLMQTVSNHRYLRSDSFEHYSTHSKDFGRARSFLPRSGAVGLVESAHVIVHDFFARIFCPSMRDDHIVGGLLVFELLEGTAFSIQQSDHYRLVNVKIMFQASC